MKKTAVGVVATSVVVLGGLALGAVLVNNESKGVSPKGISSARPLISPSSTLPAPIPPAPIPSARTAPSTGPTTNPEPVTDLSGVAMPTGNLPGWTLAAADDFGGQALNPKDWEAYSGHPRNDPDGFFDPNHLSVGGGQLVESAYLDSHDGGLFASGGIKSSVSQKYGKYDVRLKFAPGTGVAYTLVLWPSNNTWPPEVDFSSDRGADPRSTAFGVLRYGSNQTQQVTLSADLSTWNTFGVEWSPGKLVYTVNGKVWGTQNSVNVPAIPMQMAIQTEAYGCGTTPGEACPNSTTPAAVNLDVDWAVQYSYSPTTATPTTATPTTATP